MRKFNSSRAILSAALFVGLTNSALAAKFKEIFSPSSAVVKKLATEANVLVENDEVFGDASAIKVFSYERKDSEKDINTIKQLSYAKVGATVDDGHETFVQQKAGTIAKFMLAAFTNLEDDHADAYKSAVTSLSSAIEAIKGEPNLKLFGGKHADEDGSWNVLYVLDAFSKEVTLIKIGYNGT